MAVVVGCVRTQNEALRVTDRAREEWMVGDDPAVEDDDTGGVWGRRRDGRQLVERTPHAGGVEL